MGCDIHTYIEKKNEEKNRWEIVSLYYLAEYSKTLELAEPYTDRCYDLFSLLAGVRGSYEPLIEPRGLPHDLSVKVYTESDYWENDSHSHTWYDLFELALFVKELKLDEDRETEYTLLTDFYEAIENYCSLAHQNIWEVAPGKYRVIMWFDS